MKIDWKKKLSSRKFWVALAALVATVLVLFGIDEVGIEKACALVSACGVLAVYIFTEGYIDAQKNETDKESEEKEADDKQ